MAPQRLDVSSRMLVACYKQGAMVPASLHSWHRKESMPPSPACRRGLPCSKSAGPQLSMAQLVLGTADCPGARTGARQGTAVPFKKKKKK